MDDKRIYLMKEAPVGRGVIQMAIPAIIGMLVMAIYNIVDTMFVAWLGTEATGATQVVLPMIMVFGAIGLSFGIGGGSYVSRLLGEQRRQEAEKVLATCTVLSFIVGLSLTILGIVFIEPVLKIFGATDTIMPLAKDYGAFIALGGVGQVLNMNFNNMLRSEGSAKNSMIGMAVGSIVNIILDPIFIFVFGWGIKGAAIATSLSQFITTGILLYQYLGGKTILKLCLKKFSMTQEILSEIMKMGAPSFARQLLTSVSMVLMNTAAALHGGDAAIAAVGIVSRTMMLVMYVIFGLSQGFQPVAGYNYGAKAFGRLKGALNFTVLVSVGIASVSGAVFLLFGESILSIFKPTSEVMGLGLHFLLFNVVSIILMGFTNVLGSYYQAVGKGLPALVLSVARQGLFFIPLILILPHYLGLQGVFMTQAIADVLTVVFSLVFFIPTRNELNRAAHTLI
jgi:putative MATE family efflux protein